jgi:PIN domain
MTLTHILVDFENVQPTAADIGLVRGDGLRLAIFRGPGQKKYSADVAEAWQPLGGNVTFVHCSKVGRNAVDMHIAFHLGELVAASRGGAGGHARFVIVSKDTDFDPLLLYIRAQGFEASRVSTIKAALHGGAADKAEPRAAKTRSRRGKAEAAPAPAPVPEPKPAKRAAKKAPAAKKAVAKRAPIEKKEKVESLIPVPAPRARGMARLTQAPVVSAPTAPVASAKVAPDARVKVIESLQRMGEKRPAKRKGLERHIESHLGRNLEPGQLETLMSQLERDGVLVFNDKNKVEYRLPKAKK